MPTWDRQSVLDLARGFQQPMVLAAAVELELFPEIGGQEVTADELAGRLRLDLRALTVLADALAALGLLNKAAGRYSIPADLREALTPGERSILPGLRHISNLLPRWADLAQTVRTGQSYTVRHEEHHREGELEAFIEAMHVFAGPEARSVVARIPLAGARRLLDVGGGPGTYTIAFLEAHPEMSAVLFDRPPVIEIARKHITQAGLSQRATLVGGDFYADELPGGCDAAWVSAIIHQNSRQQNRELFAKVARALAPTGRIFIRDQVMDESHTAPPSGAMFAINMLTGTAGGGTYSFAEIRDDLRQAGFSDVSLIEGQAEMNCLVSARK